MLFHLTVSCMETNVETLGAFLVWFWKGGQYSFVDQASSKLPLNFLISSKEFFQTPDPSSYCFVWFDFTLLRRSFFFSFWTTYGSAWSRDQTRATATSFTTAAAVLDPEPTVPQQEPLHARFWMRSSFCFGQFQLPVGKV